MDVIGFGALNLDRLYTVERIANEGEHVPIKDVIEAPGGSAANTIFGLARLGMKTGFIGALGMDDEADIILRDFKDAGVDTGGITRIDGRTGIIIGFVDAKGERTLYPYPGVNDMIGIDDIDSNLNYMRNYVRNTKFLHLTSFVGDKQFHAQKYLVEGLKGVKISFAPGILYSRKGLDELMPIIKRSHTVFVNMDEIREITGMDYTEGSNALIESGAKIVVVTLGKDGCYITDGKNSQSIKAYKTKVLDTTGAGDAFAAGFLYGMLSGKSLRESGELGNRIASLCIQKFGARGGLPHAGEIE